MSAFVVSAATIDVLVAAAQLGRHGGMRIGDPSFPGMIEVNPENATVIGQRLWAENYRSVNYRYRENEEPEPYRFDAGAVTALSTLPNVAATVFSCAACYEYQACEHPEWQVSWAREYIAALRTYVAALVPGYDSAPWGIGTLAELRKV